MKKTAIFYTVSWFIALALFNVITFVTPSDAGNKFEGSFWAGYIFITVAFVGYLACTIFALMRNTLSKTFYSLPLIHIGYVGLLAMLIAGGVCMAVYMIEDWVAIIICAVLLCVYIIALLKAGASATLVSELDARVAAQTALMHQLTNEAKAVMLGTQGESLRAEAKKVYEALRYADPTDHAKLAELNWQIKGGVSAFSSAVKKEDVELAIVEAQNLLNMIEARNMQLKKLK